MSKLNPYDGVPDQIDYKAGDLEYKILEIEDDIERDMLNHNHKTAVEKAEILKKVLENRLVGIKKFLINPATTLIVKIEIMASLEYVEDIIKSGGKFMRIA